jgi:hypothetical protein
LHRLARALPEAHRDGRGVGLFGDLGGNFHVLDAANGQRLWSRQLGGAIGAAPRANDRQRQERHIGFRSVART